MRGGVKEGPALSLIYKTLEGSIAISMFALSIATLDVFGVWLTYLKHLLLLLFKHVRGYLSQFRIILHYTALRATIIALII